MGVYNVGKRSERGVGKEQNKQPKSNKLAPHHLMFIENL